MVMALESVQAVVAEMENRRTTHHRKFHMCHLKSRTRWVCCKMLALHHNLHNNTNLQMLPTLSMRKRKTAW